MIAIFGVSATELPEAPVKAGPVDSDGEAKSFGLPLEYDYDYSDDFSTGYYKMYIICELTIQNNCGDIYTGWMGPDGSISLGEAYALSFTVKGGDGWKFEASGSFGSDAESFGSNVIAYPLEERTGKTNYSVFISGSRWEYNGLEVQSGNFLGNGLPLITLSSHGLFNLPDFANPGLIDSSANNAAGSISRLKNIQSMNKWIIGEHQIASSAVASDACTGTGILSFVPGTVWAFPDAREGHYTFPLFIYFDYLTFDSEGFYVDYNLNELNISPSVYVFGNTQ